uniref:Plexin-B1 n=1 Tax=Pelusios castaneus TaxID=367368 RepID=A0A8C8RVY0_9SAUR
MSLETFLLAAVCFLWAVIPRGLQYVTFSHNTTKFLHLTMDSDSGTLYLGATNFLFQLTSDLMMESAVPTGPVLDSKDCLPPVSKLECPQAHFTDNHNKLLLVNSVQEELIVCGSVHQGICEKRSLASIDHILFRPESPGDTQYVAANDPNITTVGLVGHSRDDVPLLFVGRGYTSRGVGGGIPPITTRNLRPHGGNVQGADSHSIFSYEETAKLAVGRLSEYNHHFIKSFTHRSSVYFLFYRRDLKSQSREYKTYISRICLDDSHYYSYVELPLLCRSKEKTYSILQAAYVTQPGSDLARGRLSTQGEVLFTAFSAWQASSGKVSEESALCVYTMEEVDRLTTWTRDVCYTKDGKSEEGTEVAYIEYDVSSNCVQLPADTLDAYPCGSDHTPSPMASRVPLETTPLLEKSEAHLTAVAVNVEEGHTIAFLGDSRGLLHKVYLGAMGDSSIYTSLVIQLNSTVNGDLLFDQSQRHLYVMTQSMVRVPILECSQYLDCESCLTLKDPYCGWCVLQGRCSRRSECSRSIASEQWLWSFNSTQQCLSIQSLSPANISIEEKRNVSNGILLGKPNPVIRIVIFSSHICRWWATFSSVRAAAQGVSPSASLFRGSELLCMCQCHMLGCWGHFVHCWDFHRGPFEWSSSPVTLYNCSVGHADCSRCQTADAKYQCVWCGGEWPSCVFQGSCTEEIEDMCPAPLIYSVYPLSGPVEGGTRLTIIGSNLGQKHQDIAETVTVAGIPCAVDAQEYEISSSIVCITGGSWAERSGHIAVEVPGGGHGVSGHIFSYQNPELKSIAPSQGPKAGGTCLTLLGFKLLTGHPSEIRVLIGDLPCHILSEMQENQLQCQTNPSNVSLELPVTIKYGHRERRLEGFLFKYTLDPNITFGENLDLAISKEEVVAMIGEGVCVVKTLTRNHLYCEPPSEQPAPRHRTKREGTDSLPEFTVRAQLSSGDISGDASEFQGLASFVALIVLIIVFIYRKSKQALRDYKKVQIQLENLETSVRDRCKKEFTDLMTEMMDLTSDLVGTGIPFLDYRAYAERIFFPGHRESPLQRGLDVPECRRQTVEQGLVQLSNLLNSKLFLTKFIHTLEIQRTFSPRDRAYVASLLTVSLHGKLEYFTDILKTLLNDLVEQYVAKNPKLMLRRTETVVEKLLTNWMSICLYDSVGEPLYMLFRGIKHQVDKGPVDWVTGKAKYTLNDNRLLREDLEYRTLTGTAVGEAEDSQGISVKVLDCDTITQVKEKVLDQISKGTPYCQRPEPDSLDLEWRSGLAGHLILSDEDVTSVIQGNWKRLNTLQHYKVPDGATVALVPQPSDVISIYVSETPMLEDADEGGMKLWHLVKPTEEPELPKHRRGSLRDRERAKAIPEIYLTRLLSMKGTLQKFVDDLFQVILSTSRPVPLAVKYFFDLLDDQAMHHGILDPETIHIWKTNSLPLRFWINIIKNPQFVFDVQTSDNVDAVLLVIAQTFMDSCTIADHKLGRDSPINKLLYARDIPRYKQMVERYYADIRQTISASDQEMNSALAELSRNYSGELNSTVALHELYKYINKYYDQIITALEEDPTAQKMQLGYRLQQIAAAVENKVTDL